MYMEIHHPLLRCCGRVSQRERFYHSIPTTSRHWILDPWAIWPRVVSLDWEITTVMWYHRGSHACFLFWFSLACPWMSYSLCILRGWRAGSKTCHFSRVLRTWHVVSLLRQQICIMQYVTCSSLLSSGLISYFPIMTSRRCLGVCNYGSLIFKTLEHCTTKKMSLLIFIHFHSSLVHLSLK